MASLLSPDPSVHSGIRKKRKGQLRDEFFGDVHVLSAKPSLRHSVQGDDSTHVMRVGTMPQALFVVVSTSPHTESSVAQ